MWYEVDRVKTEEIKLLPDDELLKLSLKRGGRYNNYTTDALKAQAEWNRRKGNELITGNSNIGGSYIGKIDRSYYASKYY